jgi:hypothetical protein
MDLSIHQFKIEPNGSVMNFCNECFPLGYVVGSWRQAGEAAEWENNESSGAARHGL